MFFHKFFWINECTNEHESWAILHKEGSRPTKRLRLGLRSGRQGPSPGKKAWKSVEDRGKARMIRERNAAILLRRGFGGREANVSQGSLEGLKRGLLSSGIPAVPGDTEWCSVSYGFQDR